MAMVGFLDGRPTGDWKVGAEMTNCGDASVDEIVGPADAADGVVNFLGAVERDDDVIEECGDLFCTFMQEKTRRQEGEVNLLLAKEVTEGREVAVQQRFAARENDLTNTKVFEGCAVTFEILCANLIV